MKTETKTNKLRLWTEVNPKDDLWTDGAHRATVMIESTGHESIAILIDDTARPRYYRITNEKVPSFIATAVESWSRMTRGAMPMKGEGSVPAPPAAGPPGSIAVVYAPCTHPLCADRLKGDWEDEKPKPIVDRVLYASTLMAHHQMLAVAELAIIRAEAAYEHE